MTWVTLALLSAILSSARYLYIKKRCSNIPSSILVLVTRLFGSVILLPALIPHGIHITAPTRFFPILAITVILTMIATVANIKIVQTDSLSKNVPYLCFTPLFMIPWTMVLFREFPRPLAFAGILLTCAGAYLLNTGSSRSPLAPLSAIIHSKNARIMLLIALALGCTTACDKIAISTSSAVTYSFIWTAASAVVMLFVIGVRHHRNEIMAALRNRHLLIQAALWAGSFLTQMAGVQSAMGIPSGVTYVKTVTLVNVIFTVAAAGAFFNEQRVKRSFAAACIMVIGAIIVVIGK